jgi:NAD(P) transhydrogenase
MSEQFDLVVIGTGPAGEKGAAQAAYYGKRVAVIEKAPDPGGAAVHTGTLPSKTLRETALYLSGFQSRELYGLSVNFDASVEVQTLMARKAAIARTESVWIRNNLRSHDVTYVQGTARFIGPHDVEVATPNGTRQLSGRVILIATGSSPLRPSDIDMADPDIYDSDEILDLDRLPETLTILGAGVIGCEYACMFAALGVKVTLCDGRPDILTFLDAEIVDRLKAAMNKLGIVQKLGSKWTRVARTGRDEISAQLANGTTLRAEKLLFAAGRVGNTSGLGLEKLGIQPDTRGNLKVDERYQTEVPHVYAAGDVIGFPALASVSMDQGRVAICHAFGFSYKERVGALLPFGIYTIPEVSAVGETEQSCSQKGINYVVGRALYADNPRGQITGDLEGVTKLIVDAHSHVVLGVHVIGERASELVHIGQAVMQLGGKVETFIDMVFNYPTLSESYKYAAYRALGEINKRSESETVSVIRTAPRSKG